jgi:uncharacterized membrane protein YesL
MRAFVVTWRSLVSLYNELFLMVGVNLLWWVLGGFFIGATAILGYTMLYAGGPWWVAPLIAIPAGPASAALANVTHRAARDVHVDRSFFFDGLRQYWKKALGISAILGAGTALLILNMLFYFSRPEPLIQGLALLFLLLLVYWLSVQVYVFPILIGMKEPSVVGAIKMAVVMTFANPLFSVLLVVIAGALTALSVVLAILLLVAWPSIAMMMGSHALKLVVEMLGGAPAEQTDGKAR